MVLDKPFKPFQSIVQIECRNQIYNAFIIVMRNKQETVINLIVK